MHRMIPVDPNASPTREKRVMLVICCHKPTDPKRQVEWLEQNVFPRKEYPNRRLVFIGFLGRLIEMKEPWKFEFFEYWQDFYNNLRSETYFRSTQPEQHHYDFALLVNIRQDRSSGLGYGLEECCDERCPLRAMFLAARGNVLFCDWGLPLGGNPEKTMHLRVLNQYMYNEVRFRWYADKTANVPFTKIYNHFLSPTMEEEEGLPEAHMTRIRKAALGELFSERELKLAVWNAWWNMYFALDGVVVAYHRWIHFREFQYAVIQLYVYIRSWTVSSQWWELFVDSVAFTIMSVLYRALSSVSIGALDGRVSSVEDVSGLLQEDAQLLNQFLVTSVMRYAGWMMLVLIVFNMNLVKPQDRIPVHLKMKNDLKYSLLLPLCDVLVWIWWSRIHTRLVQVVCLTTSLAVVDVFSNRFLLIEPMKMSSAALQGVVAGMVVAYLPWSIVEQTARLIMEQPLYVAPLFVFGRMRLHPEVKRSLLIVPWLTSFSMIMLMTLVNYLQQCYL